MPPPEGSAEPDLYQLLECPPDADTETLRVAIARQGTAWSRRAAMAPTVEARHHAERMAQAVQRSKATLLDAARRQAYDDSRGAGLPGASIMSLGAPSDVPPRPCPHCREPIHPDARKCRWCNEWLDGTAPTKPPSRPRTAGLFFGVLTLTVGSMALMAWLTSVETADKPPAPPLSETAAPVTEVPQPTQSVEAAEPEAVTPAETGDHNVTVTGRDYLEVAIRSGDTLMTLARHFADAHPSVDDPKAKWPALARLVENNAGRRELYTGQSLRIGPASAYGLRLRMVLAIQIFCRRRMAEGRTMPILHYGRPTFGPGDFENNAMLTLPSETGPQRFLVVDSNIRSGDQSLSYQVIPESESERHPGPVWGAQP